MSNVSAEWDALLGPPADPAQPRPPPTPNLPKPANDVGAEWENLLGPSTMRGPGALPDSNRNTEEQFDAYANLLEARRISPDVAGRAAVAGAEIGVSPDVAARNAPVVEEEAAKQRDAMLLREARRTARFFSDQKNAAVAHDKVAQMGTWERLMYAAGLGAEEGYTATTVSPLVEKEMNGQPLTPGEKVLVEGWRAKRKAPTGLPEWGVSAAVHNGAAFVTGMTSQIIASVPLALATGAAVGGMAALTGVEPAVPVTAAAGAGIGLQVGMFDQGRKQATAFTYDRLRELDDERGAHLDPDTVRYVSNGVGVIGGFLNIVGMGQVAKPIGTLAQSVTRMLVEDAAAKPSVAVALKAIGGGTAKGFGMGLGLGAANEASMVAGETLAAEINNILRGTKFTDILNDGAKREEAAKAIAESAVTMGLTLAGVHVGMGAPRLATEAVRVHRASQDARFYDAIVSGAENSGLVDRPAGRDAIQRWLGIHLDDGPHETVYIPAAKLVEFYQDAARIGAANDPLFSHIEGLQKQVADALPVNGDVAIPSKDFFARLVGTPALERLKGDLRMREDGYSLNEAKEAIAQRDALLKASQARWEAEAEAGMPMDPGSRVYEHVRDQLLLGNGFTQTAAAHHAVLYAAHYETRAVRSPHLFADAWDAYQKAGTGRGVDIRSDVPERIRVTPPDQLDILLNSLRSGKDPVLPKAAPSLLDYIAKRGGMVDEGGELKARDLDKWHLDDKGRKVRGRSPIIASAAEVGQASMFGGKTVAGKKLTLNDTAVAAWEEGFFPDRTEAPTQDHLLAAIDAELRHGPAVEEGPHNAASAFREDRALLDETLNRLGLDVKKATNAQIREALAKVPEEGGRQYDQSTSPRQTETPEFKRWFAGSKVVDAEGRPLVVYHGTDAADFDVFSPGTYFSEDRREASAYGFASDLGRREKATGKYVAVSGGAEFAGQRVEFYGGLGDIDAPPAGKVYAIDDGNVYRSLGNGRWEVFSDVGVDESGKFDGETMPIKLVDRTQEVQAVVDQYEGAVRSAFPGGERGRVYPVYLSIQNPVVLGALEGNRLGRRLGASDESIRVEIEKYQAQGYDGIETTSDEGALKGEAIRQFIPFSAEQIKSAIGNRGTFDPSNPNILYQATVPPFFSAVEKAVAASKMTKGSPEQWLGTLKNTPGVKPEEMKWLGLEDWLKAQSGTVTKEQLADFIRANQIQVRDVVKSDQAPGDAAKERRLEELNRREAAGEELTPAELAEFNRLQNVDAFETDSGGTKFGTYVLPGGENYRELLLTLPPKSPSKISTPDEAVAFLSRQYKKTAAEIRDEYGYKDERDYIKLAKEHEGLSGADYHSSHWDEANVLAHVRFNDRVIDGKRTLLIEEVQSDWHQAGRKQGYNIPADRAQVLEEVRKLGITKPEGEISGGDIIKAGGSNELWNKWDNIIHGSSNVPDAPLKTTWPEFAMKRMIRYAAENGYDKIAWVPGDVQAARYDLSKQVREIEYIRNRDGTYSLGVTGINGEGVDIPNSSKMTLADIEGVVGKEIAAKIEAGEGKKYRGHAGMTLEGLDLKVGGEGMAGFYDKMLPNITNKLVKKFGAKVGEGSVPTDAPGEVFQEAGSRRWFIERDGVMDTDRTFATEAEAHAAMANGQPVHTLDITPELRTAAIEQGFAFFQDKRGSINVGNGQAIIRLYQTRNLSTLLHETGHLWLEELRADALSSGASKELTASWDATLKHLGIDPGTWDGEFTREQHEKFARSFETYLMEGKAPSAALANAFRSFKNWLVQIYRKLSALDAPISPEMREVFDRLVATDDEIKAVRDRQSLNPVFSVRPRGMSEAQFRAYTERVTAVVNDTEQRVLAKAMAGIRAKRTAEWKDEEKLTRAEVRAEAMADPGQQALHFLRTGKIFDGETPEELAGGKLSRADIVAIYGDETALRMLPRDSYRAEGGLSADSLASLFGFESGRAMLDRLMHIEAERVAMVEKGDKRSVLRAAIDREVADRMNERLGGHLDEQSIAEEAMAAVHGPKQEALMGAELVALARLAGHVGAIGVDDVKAWAARAVGEMPARTAQRFERYLKAERTAGAAMERALMKGDYVGAFKARQDQLANLSLYVEAKKAAAEIDVTRRMLDRYAGERTLKGMDQDYLEQIHGLLEDYDFKRRSDREIGRVASFEVWAANQTAAGVDHLGDALSPRMKSQIGRLNYKDMTVDEMRGLGDTVKQIAKLGRLSKELKVGAEKRDFDRTIAELVSHLGALRQVGASEERNPGVPGAGMAESRRAWMVRTRAAMRGADSSLIKMEQLFDWADDGNSNGLMNALIFRQISDRQNFENTLLREYTEKLNAIAQGVPKEVSASWLQRLDIPELKSVTPGRSKGAFLKSDLVAIALNMGNESNKDKMLRGDGWSEEAVKAALDKHLTKADWDYVQAIWDTIETLWPHVAALEREVNGVEPEKIAPLEVETPHGKYRGGYYPAAYDKTLSADAKLRIGTPDGPTFGDPRLTRATTSHGFTKGRTGFAAPILLDLGVIPRHIAEVIHDISFRQAIRQADKIFRNKDFVEAFTSAFGPEFYDQLNPWLKRIAGDAGMDKTGLAWWEKTLKEVRVNTSMVGMGLRASTMLQQVTGNFDTMEVLGPRWAAAGHASFVGDPLNMAATRDFVFEKSGEMRFRMDNLERDVRDGLRSLLGQKDALSEVRRFAFYGIGMMDMTVSMPAWMGAYKKALHEGMSDADAAYYADKVVRQTQGSGAAKDLSNWHGTSNEAMKLTTMFYSWASHFYNRTRAIGRDAMEARGTGDFAMIAARSLYLVLLPAIAGPLLTASGPKDDESFLSWATRKVAFGAFQGVPIARDVASYAERKVGGDYAQYTPTPAARGVEVMEKLIVDMAHGTGLVEGDVSDKWLQHAIEAPGYIFGLPTGQPASTTQFLWDLHTGNQTAETVGEWYRGLLKGKAKND